MTKIGKVVSGAARFRDEAYQAKRALFAELATRQNPEVLIITCADSRIDPNLVTQSEPGELFVCRNAGNIVPPHQQMAGGVTASIEFAVAGLGVRDVVVCGHTDCGAIKGALNPDALTGLPHVLDWLRHVEPAIDVVRGRGGLSGGDEVLAVIEANVMAQLANLTTHPCIEPRLAAGEIALHAWVYDIETGAVTCHDEATDSFVPIEERYATLLAAAVALEEG
jgi:carbonic anhydrase